MKVRSFHVPFAEIVPEATEWEFDESDCLVLVSLFAKSAGEVAALAERMTAVAEKPPAEQDALLLDLLDAAIVEWHLVGPDGPIEKPKTRADLQRLPVAIAGSLFPFISEFRGNDHPTTRA